MFAAWAGNRSEAIKAYRQSIVSFQELADRYPEMLVFPYMVSMHRHVLGEYLRTVGQLAESRSELEKSASGLESLLQSKPDAPAAVRNYLRRVYQTWGKTLDELGDHKSADAIREKARSNR
jgi:tetratricopeptide (TPR) repeat protein